MLIYSKTITSFIAKVKNEARSIMNMEMGLNFKKTRFEYLGHLYPIHFVVFEDPSKLGQFVPSHYQIALHKKLMFLAKDEVLRDIIRHELAHLYTFIKHGPNVENHGREYHETCKGFNWGPNVSRAYSDLNLDNAALPPDENFNKIKSRIEKLMALSESNNSHEAQMATAKANEYLLKYNLKNIESKQEEEICVLGVYKAKRMNATVNALYDIITHFYVQPILNRSREGINLEVVGSRINVETADYVVKCLCYEFERLWKKASKEDSNLKGINKKNSYINGLASGFVQKIKKEKQPFETSHAKELLVLNGVLKEQVAVAYPRLSRQGASQASLCGEASAKGFSDGLSLSLKKGIKQGNKGLRLK